MGYGYPAPGQGTSQPVRPRAPISPNNRPGPQGANPAFPSLTAPKARPNQAPTFTPDQVTQSLAANPQASHGGYTGPPMGPQYPPPNPAPVPPVAPNVGYDYNTDPILQQAQALSGKNRGDAQSGALAARKQLAIDYNDVALANQLGDTNTAQAAANNPFGVLEQLKHSYNTGAHNLDEQLNNQNLFYGGHRAQEQGNLTHDYQGQLAGAAGQEQGLLGGISGNLLAALSNADAADIAAAQDAAARGMANPAAVATPAADTTQTAATPPPDAVATALGGLPAPFITPGSSIPQIGAGIVGLGTRALQSAVPAAGADPLALALSQQNRKKLLRLG